MSSGPATSATRGLDLLGLPTGTISRIGSTAELRVTGPCNPCVQLDWFKPGLMVATFDRDEAGNLKRRAGIMTVVQVSGEVRPSDPIEILVPSAPPRRLIPV